MAEETTNLAAHQIVQRMVEDHQFAHQFLFEQQQKAQTTIQNLPTEAERIKATQEFNQVSSRLHELWAQEVQQQREQINYGGMGEDEEGGEEEVEGVQTWCNCKNHYLLEEPKSEMVRALEQLNALHIQEQEHHDQILKNAFTSELV